MCVDSSDLTGQSLMLLGRQITEVVFLQLMKHSMRGEYVPQSIIWYEEAITVTTNSSSVQPVFQ